jgi:thiol-disulfide isomerase/thioredoxin
MMVAPLSLRSVMRFPVPVSKSCFATAIVLLAIVALQVKAQGADAKASGPVVNSSADNYRTNPKFIEVMKEARQLERQKRVLFAEDDYKKANKIAGGQCFDCLQGVYETQMQLGDFKAAIATSAELETVATSPVAKSIAAYYRGQALVERGGEKAKPAQLEEAHAAFQEAISLYPKNPAALFGDGKVLARLGKMDEARTDFQKCSSCAPATDPARLRAQHFADDPELSTHKMAPPIEITALDGTKFNLDAMGGRVVLIDFWATWCGPCNEELPHMRKIAKEFANDPFVMISVSWDSDDGKWKQFIEKNEMTWLQYRDGDHTLSDEFGINAIPHYFTIDSDGVLTAEMLGSGSDVEGKLKKLIVKAREAKSQAHEGQAAANAGS